MSGLMGKNIVVFDLEIENEIDGTNVTWTTFDKMGFSVGCLYDYMTDDYHVFLKEDIEEMAVRINTAAVAVGFNTKSFDTSLVNAISPTKIREDMKHYDMLIESRKAIGWKEGDRFPSGMKLDDHLEFTFGKAHMKTGHGELAPRWWREGKKSKVISYCLADVKREKKLFDHICYKGWAGTKTHGRRFFDLSSLAGV